MRRLGRVLAAVALCLSIAGRPLPGSVLQPGAVLQQSEEVPSVRSSDLFSLELMVPKKQMMPGEPLWVALVVTNTGTVDLVFPETQVHVEGARGEPPMTLYQRQMSHKLNPGERELPPSGFSRLIHPTVYEVQRFDLSRFYLLTEPGRYTVSVDVWDAKKGVWERSPAAEFELLPAVVQHP